MKKDAKSVVKKTVKVAGVTCMALGGAALIASGAALKAVTEGAKYLKDTIRKIVDGEPVAEPVAEEPLEAPVEVSEEAPAEEAPVTEPVVEEEVLSEDENA